MMSKISHESFVSVFDEGVNRPQLGALVKVGWLVRIGLAGDVYVDFFGNDQGPIITRIAMSASEISDLKNQPSGAQVLLTFEEDSFLKPILVGLIRDRLPSPKPEGKEVFADGKLVTIVGEEQVILRCGESSLSLMKNGKIILKGVDLVSRAMRGNRIRGGTVKIN